MTRWGLLAGAAVFLNGGVAGAAAPDGPPTLPCAGSAAPAPAGLGEPPHVTTFAPGPSWMPPACSGWTDGGARSLVAVSGTVTIPGGTEGVLARFGAVSRLAGIRYWSVSGQAWETLISQAAALDRPAGKPRRDFSPGEMIAGRDLFFSQTDNDSGAQVYRLRVVARSDARVVLSTENVGTIRRFLVSLFGPGELQSAYVVERTEREDVWRYYSLTRAKLGASALTDGHEASTVNRAVALFRHVGGIATDREPPAARR